MPYKSLNSGTMWDFTLNPVLEGNYLLKEENIGTNESNLYHLEEMNTGDEVVFWGSTALDRQMEQIKTETRIRITFKGLVDSPKRPGKQYKSYIV